MKNYLDGMRHIRDYGHVKTDRTGTGTRSVCGMELRFDLKNDQFPLVTTKKLYIRGIVEELLWFLRGSTDNNELAARKVGIWDEWALPEDYTQEVPLNNHERAALYAEKMGISTERARRELGEADRHYLINHPEDTASNPHAGGHALLDGAGIPRTRKQVLVPAGSLGPIYGKQWRDWRAPDGRRIDQIANALELLRKSPDSRRNIVTAWNPADLPLNGESSFDAIKGGRMALAACHCMFQLWTRPLTNEERVLLFADALGDLKMLWGKDEARQNAFLDEQNVPRFALSCVLTQRSADYFLGVPFNIASYALLTRMFAAMTNMVADELVWHGGDVHLYSNHEQQVAEQLSRRPRSEPKLRIKRIPERIEDFQLEDFEITGYDPHPAIKAPVAV